MDGTGQQQQPSQQPSAQPVVQQQQPVQQQPVQIQQIQPTPLTIAPTPSPHLIPLKTAPSSSPVPAAPPSSSTTTTTITTTLDPTLQIFPPVSDPTPQIQLDLQHSHSQEEESSNPTKRQAHKGQWQTPPLGQFPSKPSSSTSTTNATTTTPFPTLSVPHSRDDYAKALQEAYRRGAEAAAAMNKSHSASNIAALGAANLTFSMPSVSGSPNATTTSGGGGAGTAVLPEPTPIAHAVPPPQPMTVPSTTTTTTVSVPPPAASVANPLQTMIQPTPPNNTNNNNPSTTVTGVPTPLPLYPAAPTSTASTPAPPATAAATAASSVVVPTPVTSNGRSLSMPDMSTYAAKANDEESKRLKRLARNRASARLRRLRKKNLVESYEGEVGVLESSLAKLRAHRWGVHTDPEALLEALSMDRGQQTISPIQRKELIQSLLQQQREQVKNVMDCQLETMMLGWIARQGGEQQQQQQQGEDSGMFGTEETKEVDALAAELNSVLQLTPEQTKQLQSATEGMEEERRAVQVVDTSLSALLTNEWLMNTGIQECTDQFTSILNPTQLSKFLLWSDANSESIDQLDYVNAPPANAQPGPAPMFLFGMEEGHHGEEGV